GVPQANHTQRGPWVSKDIIKDPVAYGSLCVQFSPHLSYFLICCVQIYLHRPRLAERLDAYVMLLPHNAACPWAPFGGIVVNFNACSDAHRDKFDLENRCVVMPLPQNCRGGALVLQEARLVLDLHLGNVVLFPSGRFTHFNLHY
ncbi:hypothetical protein B0H12DRAFT_997032, partial [Mycena haematopus]